MLNVLSIVGTRPEAIKMAPVIRALRTRDGVCPLLCSTGQHRDLLQPVWDLFGLRPDFELHVMEDEQSLAALSARLFERVDAVMTRVRPDWVLAEGDTTSVLVSALVSHYHGVPFGHVEAGLRTGDRRRPFPEEVNRCVADQVADLCFAPTEENRAALLAVGTPAERIVVTGNPVVDAVRTVADVDYDWNAGPLAGVPRDRRLVLVTAHRRESFGAPLQEIFRAVQELAARFEGDGVHFVYPVHPNPRVRSVAERMLADAPNTSLVAPLDYLALVQLMKRACLVLSDSGGIQEEAPGLGVPLLVLREVTERPEGIAAGVAKLVGTDAKRIVDEASVLLTDAEAHAAMARRTNPYGDGRAAGRIAQALLDAARP